MPNNEAKYQIERKTYKFRATGEMDKNNRPIFEKMGEPKTGTVKNVSNFGALKRILMKAEENGEVKIHYKDIRTYTEKLDKFGRTSSIRRNPRQIDYVTKNLGNGEYEKTYYSVKHK